MRRRPLAVQVGHVGQDARCTGRIRAGQSQREGALVFALRRVEAALVAQHHTQPHAGADLQGEVAQLQGLAGAAIEGVGHVLARPEVPGRHLEAHHGMAVAGAVVGAAGELAGVQRARDGGDGVTPDEVDHGGGVERLDLAQVHVEALGAAARLQREVQRRARVTALGERDRPLGDHGDGIRVGERLGRKERHLKRRHGFRTPESKRPALWAGRSEVRILNRGETPNQADS